MPLPVLDMCTITPVNRDQYHQLHLHLHYRYRYLRHQHRTFNGTYLPTSYATYSTTSHMLWLCT